MMMDSILIMCADNGEPYALDPKTLETEGRLVDVVPKLKEVFPEGTKFLAHTRHDETKERFVMCTTNIVGDHGFEQLLS
jgi:carotenoid cleavage dioxygenase-like enzyme